MHAADGREPEEYRLPLGSSAFGASTALSGTVEYSLSYAVDYDVNPREHANHLCAGCTAKKKLPPQVLGFHVMRKGVTPESFNAVERLRQRPDRSREHDAKTITFRRS